MKKMKKLLAILVLALLVVCMNVQPSEAATIKLNKTELDMQMGQTKTLKVSGTKKKVTWKSSKKSVAKVSSKGKITAKKAGKTIISAKVSGKTLKCTVYVFTPSFARETYKIPVKTSYKIQLEYADYGTIKWYSSNKSVAKVSSKGVITTGSKKGNAKIKAVYRGKNYTCTVSAINYEDNYKKLKTKILESTMKDDDGNPYLGMRTKVTNTYSDEDAIIGVYYLEDEDLFKFVYTDQGGSYQDQNEDGTNVYVPDNTTVCMYLNIVNSNTAKVSVECQDGDESLSAKGELDPNTFNEESDSAFNDITYTDQFVEKSDYYEAEEGDAELKPAEKKEIAGYISNILFCSAMGNWNQVLQLFGNMDLNDLGFISLDADTLYFLY